MGRVGKNVMCAVLSAGRTYYIPKPGSSGTRSAQKGLLMLPLLTHCFSPMFGLVTLVFNFLALPGPHLSWLSIVERRNFLLGGKPACLYCFWNSAQREEVLAYVACCARVCESTSQVLTNHACLQEADMRGCTWNPELTHWKAGYIGSWSRGHVQGDSWVLSWAAGWMAPPCTEIRDDRSLLFVHLNHAWPWTSFQNQ